MNWVGDVDPAGQAYLHAQTLESVGRGTRGVGAGQRDVHVQSVGGWGDGVYG
jgi:hypothetical protein